MKRTSLALGLAMATAGTAFAQPAPTEVATRIADSLRPTAAAQISCAGLANQRFDGVTLLKTSAVEAADGIPAHCQVTGVISPEIQFEIALPEQWNRRLYMFGNGGYAGEDLLAASRIATRNSRLGGGFLTVQQNSGHDSRTYPLGTFAHENLSSLIDYSSRAVHETVSLAKSLADAYYLRPPAYSYWEACSTGGRQGLMSAQRHPGDFDGIIAGAPVLDFTETQLWGVWNAQALLDAEPLTTRHLEIFAKAVLDNCDADDGLEDGLVTDPRQCGFDPELHLPVCEQGAQDCFTPAQVQAIKRIGEGVVVAGERVFPGVPWGVEGIDGSGVSGWSPWIVSDNGPSRQLAYGETFLQNMAMLPASGRDIDWKSFDFDANYDRIQMIRGILDATDPDLSAFADRGGRIIGYFGWADPALNPMMNIDYYEKVRETLGEEATAEVYRLFMVPGMAHCRGGYGPDTFDAFSHLIDWVENGTAPTQILASQMQDGAVLRSRPLCAYPEVALYDGSGDGDDPASFSCGLPD